MGYIVREPKDIVFTVINREMTTEERRRLSDFIDKRKKEIDKMREKQQPF
jgi:hypothetical protein